MEKFRIRPSHVILMMIGMLFVMMIGMLVPTNHYLYAYSSSQSNWVDMKDAKNEDQDKH